MGMITPRTILKDGDRITVTPKHVVGAFQPIKLKAFICYAELKARSP